MKLAGISRPSAINHRCCFTQLVLESAVRKFIYCVPTSGPLAALIFFSILALSLIPVQWVFLWDPGHKRIIQKVCGKWICEVSHTWLLAPLFVLWCLCLCQLCHQLCGTGVDGATGKARVGLQAFGECISQGGHTLVLKSEIYFGALFHNVHFLFFFFLFLMRFFSFIWQVKWKRGRDRKRCAICRCVTLLAAAARANQLRPGVASRSPVWAAGARLVASGPFPRHISRKVDQKQNTRGWPLCSECQCHRLQFNMLCHSANLHVHNLQKGEDPLHTMWNLNLFE